MKVNRSKLIAVLLTTVIFGSAVIYVFGLPSSFPALPDFKEWFSSNDDGDDDKKGKKSNNRKKSGNIGKVIDSFNGVDIYYNGRVANIQGRNVTSDGYNLGLRYQCVEFVKRYYYEYYNHKMPDSYGNAKDFYSYAIEDGQINPARNLRQFSNPSKARPKIGDLIIFGPTPYNKFGHVGIISKVERNRFEIAQQNPGSNNPSRQWFDYEQRNSEYFINHEYVLGLLRKS